MKAATQTPVICDSTRLASLQARAALAGHQLTATKRGGFMLSRWVVSRHCTDLDTVEALLQSTERYQQSSATSNKNAG